MNGRPLAPADPSSPNTAFAVPSSEVVRGDNALRVGVTGQTVGSVLLREVALDVAYRR